jgi:hypothetical protein
MLKKAPLSATNRASTPLICAARWASDSHRHRQLCHFSQFAGGERLDEKTEKLYGESTAQYLCTAKFELDPSGRQSSELGIATRWLMRRGSS